MACFIALDGWPDEKHDGDVYQGGCQHDSVLRIEHHEGCYPGQTDDPEDTRDRITRHMETGIRD